MARFVRIDSAVPELNPFFCESRFGALKTASRRFEAIRANRSTVMKFIGFFCESIRANRPNSQGPPNGGVSNGFPDLDLSFLFCPFLSFFVLFGTFPIFL